MPFETSLDTGLDTGSAMLSLVVAAFFNALLFLTGFVLSLIDVNRFNFGLFLALVAIVGFCVILAVWAIRPRCLETERCWDRLKSCRRTARQRSSEEDVRLVDNEQVENVLRSIRGIPYLIQAIQYSMETAFDIEREAATSGNTDSAIEVTEVAETTDLSADMNWKQTSDDGRNWANPRLNLTLAHSTGSVLLMFPLSESFPQPQPEDDSTTSPARSHGIGRTQCRRSSSANSVLNQFAMDLA